MEEEIKPELNSIQGNLFELKAGKSSDELPYLILAKDPGAAACLTPVIELLMSKDKRIFLFAKDKANEHFTQKFSSNSTLRELRLESIVEKGPTIILASGTSDPEYEGKLIQHLTETNPKNKIVLIEDFPGSLVRLMEKLASLDRPILPDLIFTTSRSSQENMIKRFPTFGKDNIIPVGQPAFDSLLLEETQSINQKVRENLGISPTDLLVTYIGVPSQDHPGLNSEALSETVSVLNKIAETRGVRIHFINRNHPREANAALYTSILETANDKVKVVDEPQHLKMTTRELTASSNLIVTTISTAGLETALRGSRPKTKLDQTGWLPLHILLPQAQEFIRKTAGVLPVIELEATAVAPTEGEIEPTMEQSLFNSNFQKRILDAQQGPLRKEYRFYGRRKKTSAERVILWLRRFERTKRNSN